MDFRCITEPSEAWSQVAADALLVVLAGEGAQAALSGPLAEALTGVVRRGDLSFKPGRTAYLASTPDVRATRVVFAVARDASPKAFKAAVSAGLSVVSPLGVAELAVAAAGFDDLGDAHAERLVLAVADATYVYRHTKPSAPPAGKLKRVTVVCAAAQAPAVKAGLARGEGIAEGVTVARECANRPGNHCTPSFLADEARRLAKAHGFDVEVLGPKEVEKLGMGSFMAVAKGSEEPLRFIVLRYQGAGKKDAPVALVGKGITFDTGGISIKPAPEMDEMKFDMGGAASVLGTFRALGALKPRINVVGLIPACENMPDGRAVKPGDVVTSMSGQTIEILNTDAEGRLILCDALTYAERFKPQAVVDIATLTGACVIALGHQHSGLFAADEALAADLLAASQTSGDTCWRMPLDEEYDEALKSNFADMGNVGGRAGGAITAALFLKRFTAKYPWAHLDIAGTAWKSGAAKGATGRPVGLLTHMLLRRAAAAEAPAPVAPKATAKAARRAPKKAA
jgi:leucyl aminopeptidase